LQSHVNSKGKLYIIGIGPGDPGLFTRSAVDALTASDYIIGNTFYLNQIGAMIAGKTVIPSAMGKEVERAQRCIGLARDHTVVMVSGGDPGIYGMASIVLEVLERTGAGVEVEVIPGVTAATAAAARLGSPLSGDYVTMSLSDLLTPLEIIRERLQLAFQMGIPVALYNPKSRGRPHNLSLALSIALEHCREETPVGVVKNAYRPEEETILTTLGQLRADDSCVDMRSIVIIGGEETRFLKEDGDVKGIITPRGYHRKYVY
jgi:precorrin-3B C17-methyltransferase